MKPVTYLISLFWLFVGILPAFAQTDPNLIALNDLTPSIDVVITLPTDTTGTIALDVQQVGVQLRDANNQVVFQIADTRLHRLEFNLAPNKGTHTLIVERLEGITEGYVRVTSLPELMRPTTSTPIDGTQVSLAQVTALPLDTNQPGRTVSVDVVGAPTGVIHASFHGVSAMTQLVDQEGRVIAESVGGHIDGFTFLVDEGEYQFTVLGEQVSQPAILTVGATSLESSGYSLLDIPSPMTTATDSVSPSTFEQQPIPENNTLVVQEVPTAPMTYASAPVSDPCQGNVSVSSANLRSGPGTGYSILGYGYQGESYPIGGINPQNNWVVVGTDNGASAWMSLTTLQTQGTCDNLTVFNVPFRDLAPAQVIVSASTSSVSSSNSSSSLQYAAPVVVNQYQEYDDHDDEHEEEEHEDHEEEEHEDHEEEDDDEHEDHDDD